jgi:hypothetical protein
MIHNTLSMTSLLDLCIMSQRTKDVRRGDKYQYSITTSFRGHGANMTVPQISRSPPPFLAAPHTCKGCSSCSEPNRIGIFVNQELSFKVRRVGLYRPEKQPGVERRPGLPKVALNGSILFEPKQRQNQFDSASGAHFCLRHLHRACDA